MFPSPVTSSTSTNKDLDDVSTVSAKLEALRMRILPNVDNPSASHPDANGERRPAPMNFGNPSLTRKRAVNLPIPSMQSNRDTNIKLTEAQYQEVLLNDGLFHINGERKHIRQEDIVKAHLLGSGSCGEVFRMEHKPSQTVLAVKVMFRTTCVEENQRIIRDLDVLVKSYNFPHIVCCLGYFIKETEVWICMELMASCFDKLLKRIRQPIPESILGKLTVSTVTALTYLKDKHGIMHRDVKPSNILIDEQGNIKLCDFGVSGVLIDSKAKSRNAGCAAYMSPERIQPPEHGYDVRADVWSLGISLIELATNLHPYSNRRSDFDVMSCIVMEESPQLTTDLPFSDDFRSFVSLCLIKDYQQRPKYALLMNHPFFIQSREQSVDVADWYRDVTTAVIQK